MLPSLGACVFYQSFHGLTRGFIEDLRLLGRNLVVFGQWLVSQWLFSAS
jgi:hypothetical protein